MKKVDKDVARYSRCDMKLEKKMKKKLRSPLNVGEIVLVLSARIKKKTLLPFFVKALQTRKAFLTRINNL